MKYSFILGHNPKLSVEEILAVLPKTKVIEQSDCFLILENKEFDCQAMMRRLGGTVKIGTVIDDKISAENIAKDLMESKIEGKVRFGVSEYGKSKIKNQKSKLQIKNLKFGLDIKRLLKENGVSSRLVTSREEVLSAVVITKNKCQEYLILDDEFLAKTCAVQEFAEYSFRDYGRPVRDLVSGTMPPKLAKIMINLAQVSEDAKILDPFCGSGTVLQEALLLGYKNIIGCDVSAKAVEDTKKNLSWLKKNFQFLIFNFQITQCDVKELSKQVKPGSVDAIITEPYLGPALRGSESLEQLRRIMDELAQLYLAAFKEFKKILRPGGKVVIIFPVFVYKNQQPRLPILEPIKKIGFSQLNKEKLIYPHTSRYKFADGKMKENLAYCEAIKGGSVSGGVGVYGRPGQKIWREIVMLEK